MPVEIFFAHPGDIGRLTLDQLATDLSLAGFPAKITEDKGEQIWIEFEGFKSRLLTMKQKPISLITLQIYGDYSIEALLIENIEALLQPHGYIDAEQFPR